MKMSRYTTSQIAAVPNGAKPASPSHSSRASTASTSLRISSGSRNAAELKPLRELEAENARLKRMYADLALENTVIKGRA